MKRSLEYYPQYNDESELRKAELVHLMRTEGKFADYARKNVNTRPLNPMDGFPVGKPFYLNKAVNQPGFTRTVGAYARSLPGAIEKKYFDTNASNTADLSSGSVLNSLNLIPQGIKN